MNATFPLILRRDLRVAYRRLGDLGNPLVFFLIVVSLFPLALSPERELLARVAPGILWVGALLAGLLSLERLFRDDLRDGTLEQMALSGRPLAGVVLAKVGVHWLTTGLPLVILAWPASQALYLPGPAQSCLLLSLALGTVLLSLLGGFGAALTAGTRDGGLLLALIALPLMVPVIIFGARATDMAARGLSAAGPLYLLGAATVLGLTLLPLATAMALRIDLE